MSEQAQTTQRPAGDTPAVATLSVDNNMMWRTCLHEAGHVVAGQMLLKRVVGAMVFSDASGVTNMGAGTAVPRSFGEAMATAAGIAAGTLASHYAPPDIPLPIPLDKAYPEAVEPAQAAIATVISDDVAIARWCIQGRETQPDMWAKHHDWVHSSAQEFVLENRHAIIEVATVLYGCGIITLPATPAMEGAKEC